MKYELFYATGGHGGPYEGKAAALEAARRLVGGANGSYIDVVPYSQPWEATPVRDLHLLRGVERVYAAPDGWYSEEYETLADKMFAERNPGARAAESIYVMKAGEGNYYARRTTKPPKYLRWELQLPDPRSWGGGMKRAHYRPAGGKLYSRSGLSARFETLKEIKKAYPGDWRKVQ